MSTYNRPTLSTTTLIDQTVLINTFPFNATDYSEYANVVNTYTNPIQIDGLDTGSLLLTETTIKGNQRNLSVTTSNASTLNLNDNKTSGDLFINNNSSANTYIKTGNIYFDALKDQTISYNDANKTIISKDSVKSPSFIGTVSTATNIGGGSIGQLLYQSAVDTTAKLTAGSNGNILTYGGSSAPTWTDFSSSLFTTNRITEVINTAVTSGAIRTCNYNNGGIFTTTAHTANFTIALTNIPTNSNRAVNITLLIDTSTNKFYGNTITVNGSATSPIYNGGSSAISISSATLVIQQITIIYLVTTTPSYVISSVNSVF